LFIVFTYRNNCFINLQIIFIDNWVLISVACFVHRWLTESWDWHTINKRSSFCSGTVSKGSELTVRSLVFSDIVSRGIELTARDRELARRVLRFSLSLVLKWIMKEIVSTKATLPYALSEYLWSTHGHNTYCGLSVYNLITSKSDKEQLFPLYTSQVPLPRYSFWINCIKSEEARSCFDV
jgi:hypothetical protein